MKKSSLLLSGIAYIVAVSCGGDGEPAVPRAEPPVGSKPATLAEWTLFADAPAQKPAGGVIPYEMRSPLFTDYALKLRFLYLPEGEKIDFKTDEAWEFPVGSILIKTFAYPNDERDPSLGIHMIETRLVVHEEDGWKVFTYEWNDEQTEATRLTSGRNFEFSWIGSAGETRTVNYGIPSNGTCRKCHGTAPDTRTLGPSTGMMNMMNDYGDGPVNQIDHLESLGLLDETPPPPSERQALVDPEDPSADPTEKGRAYLHANCGHCHSPEGEDADQGLFLDYLSTDPVTTTNFQTWGVCKMATSAGNAECTSFLDVIPGDPDSSLMPCRMEIDDEAGKMPPSGRSVAHVEGIEIVRGWIAAMDLPACGQ